MSTLRFDDYMSETDAMLWVVERDPVLRSTIVIVLELETAPDLERFQNALRGLVHTIPRFRQRVVDANPNLAPPRWEDDPDFDLTNHVRHVALPSSAGPRALLALAEAEGVHSFDKDRPLWELVIVDRPGDEAAVIVKIHHSIADGMGLLAMAGALMEFGPDEPRDAHDHWVPSAETMAPGRRTADAARHRLNKATGRIESAARRVVDTAASVVRDPVGSVRQVAEVAASAARVMKPTTQPMSPMMLERSSRLRFDALDVEVDVLRRIGAVGGGRLNDGFVAVALDGLRRYHDTLGVALPELRMSMAVNARDDDTADEGGNHLSGIQVTIPTDMSDGAPAIGEVVAVLQRARSEAALPYVMALLNGAGQVSGPGAARLLGTFQKTTDLVTSNLPGPPVPLWMSGARIVRFLPFGPRAGGAVNLTLLSYDGVCHIGVNSDPVAVHDPELLVQSLRDAVSSLAEATA